MISMRALPGSMTKLCIISILLGLVCVRDFGQEKGGILEQTVNSFNVNHISRIDAVLLLAKQLNQPLGIEYAGPELFEPVTVNANSAKIGTIIDLLFPPSIGFQVAVEDGVILINRGNSLKGLDTVLTDFSIPRCSVLLADALLRVRLSQQVNPDKKRGYGLSVSGEESERIGPFVLTDVTVRQALNRIVRDRGAAAWIVQEEPQADNQPLDSGFAERILDGRQVLWTVVEYDSPLISSIGQITRERALAVSPPHH